MSHCHGVKTIEFLFFIFSFILYIIADLQTANSDFYFEPPDSIFLGPDLDELVTTSRLQRIDFGQY